MTAGLTAMASTAEALPTFSFTRLAGADRYDTARAIAVQSFPAGSDWAIIATGENFPDALAGNYLAGFRNAPILLTPKAAPVHPQTLTALNVLKTKNVILLGGVDAISAAVEASLSTTASTAAAGGNLLVTRIGGATRYDTMKLINAAPGVTFPGVYAGKKTAIVVSGENFPDALSVGPISWAMKFPTVLTFTSSLAPSASESLSDLGIQQVIIAGGTAAVSAITEAAINAKGISTLVRFDGVDRSDTSRKAADYAINNFGFSNSHFNVATGENSKIGADALSGGPHGGRETAPNLVTNSSTDPGKVIDFAAGRCPTLATGHIFGGVAAIPVTTETAITNAARCQAPNPGVFNPSGDLSRVNSTTGTGTATDTRGLTNFTITGLTGSVDVVLVTCDIFRPATTSSLASFANANSNQIADQTALAGLAPDASGTGAVITSINGANPSDAGADFANNVAVSGGTLNVSVDNPGNNTSPCVRVLVFNDTNNNDALDINPATGIPTETFAISGKVQFLPERAANGSYGPNTVLATDKTGTNNLYSADVPGPDRSFAFDANDLFFVNGAPASFSVFRLAISPGDTVSTTYSSDPAAVSIFQLTDLAPAPVTGVALTSAAGPGTTSVVIRFNDSATPTVDAYRIFRQVDPTPGNACEAPTDTTGALPSGYALVVEIPDFSGITSGDPTYQYTDPSLTNGTTYCYIVRAVDDQDESANNITPAGPQQITVGSGLGGAVGGAPFLLDSRAQDAGTIGILDAGDVIQLVASEPLAITADDPGSTFRLRDADGTVVELTCGGNVSCFLQFVPPLNFQGQNRQANQVLRIQVNTTPNTAATGLLAAGTAVSLQYPATIINVSASVRDADEGNPLNLSTGDVTVDASAAPNFIDPAPGPITNNSAPTAAAIAPNTGPAAGGTAFTITGTNLQGATADFCGGNVPVTSNAAGTQLTGTTPARPVGGCAITITNAGGQTTVPGGFTFNPAPPPADVTAPTVVSAVQTDADGDATREILITFSEPVTCGNTVPGSATAAAFTFTDQSAVTPNSGPATDVDGGPGANQCFLDEDGGTPYFVDDFGVLTYLQPAASGDRIKDTAGNDAASFVINVTDGSAPVFVSVSNTVAGATVLTLNFSEPICGTVTPDDFTVTQGITTYTVSAENFPNVCSTAAPGTAVATATINLAAPLVAGPVTVTISPEPGDIRDPSGNNLIPPFTRVGTVV